jgi:chloramphenicol-sensitive protein RarD
VSQLRLGYLYGFGAHLLWGFFPLYFKLLRPSGPIEVLGHRVFWSMVVMVIVITVMRRWREIGGLFRNRARLGTAALAALLIGMNWGTYIYGVNSDHVVETALGYFITPLVVIILGLTALGERLRRWQWIAVGLGAAAVVILTVDYGRPPWIALILASTFGLYGLIKKRLNMHPADGLLIESSVIAVPAIAALALLSYAGKATVGTVSPGHTALVMSSGAITAVPLLMFAGAANRIPMVGLGILQYIGPSIQLILGVFLFHEPMPQARLIGFGLVWLALVFFSWDGLAQARRSARAEGRSVRRVPEAAADGPLQPV